jgi:AcrR family transcriptional regulator
VARTYNSPAREAAARKTREALLDAALDVALEVDSNADLTHKEVAERAGVSLRTAYNHFPSRDELLDAVDAAIAQRLGRADLDADDPVEVIAGLYAFFERNAGVLRAARSRPQRALRERRRAKRKGRLDAWAEKTLPDASAAERRELAALARVFLSSDTWLELHDGGGLSAKAAAGLAEQVLTAEVRRRRRRSRRQPE